MTDQPPGRSDSPAPTTDETDETDTETAVVNADMGEDTDPESQLRSDAEDEFKRYFTDTPTSAPRADRIKQTRDMLASKHEDLVAEHQQLTQQCARLQALIDDSNDAIEQVEAAADRPADEAATFSRSLELGVRKSVPHDELPDLRDDLAEKVEELEDTLAKTADKKDTYHDARKRFKVAIQVAGDYLAHEERFDDDLTGVTAAPDRTTGGQR